MVFSYVGDPYINIFRICKLDKKLMPWLYMLMIYFTIPDSSFLGHFCGLIAGLLIKFCGVYLVLPSYDTISSFDETIDEDNSILCKQGYFKAKDVIDTDFDGWFWKTITSKIRKAFLRVRHRLFGYEYV